MQFLVWNCDSNHMISSKSSKIVCLYQRGLKGSVRQHRPAHLSTSCCLSAFILYSPPNSSLCLSVCVPGEASTLPTGSSPSPWQPSPNRKWNFSKTTEMKWVKLSSFLFFFLICVSKSADVLKLLVLDRVQAFKINFWTRLCRRTFLSGARMLPTCSGRKQQQDRRRLFPLHVCLL